MILDRLINCFNLALIFGTISCKCASDIIGVTSCCDFDDQIACLSAKNISVANRIFHEKAKHDASFTLVTYTTTSIFNYSLYSFAVNSVHADLNGHNMILTSDALGAEFERHDQRWNKVKVMEVIIKNHLHEAFDVEKDQYLVWMDSDLIFLDLHFNLTEIVQQHAHADLIVSQDVDRLNGIVNTGCMIMRCSEWSLRFLQDWWAWADHVEGMDQHVFDRLYQHLLETESTNCTADVDITDTREVITARKECAKTKIVILPPHALNSHIPARQHQHPSHQIMHLAGESSAVRAHVFRAAFAEICRAYTSAAVSTSQTLMETLKAVPSNPPAVPAVPTKLPAVFGSQEQVPTSAWVNLVAPQLGVTRDFLQKIDVASLLVAEIRCILDEMNSCSAQAPLLCDLVTIDKVTTKP